MIKHFTKLIFLITISQLFVSCDWVNKSNNQPKVFLWAWERNEDLRFIQNNGIGVAYLTQTIFLTDDEVILKPRKQPLKVLAGTYLVAVTRIESKRNKSEFTQKQIDETAQLIIKSSLPYKIKGVQIDFDVKVSERVFYKKLIEQVRKGINADKKFTITALASFCVGDKWMKDLQVDEAVPMLFEMGMNGSDITSFLRKEKDFNEDLCKESYGLLLNEKNFIEFKEGRAKYYFKYTPWKKNDLEKIK